MRTESARDIDYSTRGLFADLGATFGGVLLLLSSGMGLLQGLSAVANDDLYAAGSDYLYKLDMTTWGTVHIVLAVIGAVVAVGILMGKSWARVLGMIIAGLSALTNFAFLPHYPLWSIVIIAFDVAVIWALSTMLGARRH